jgi:hypothetical protein
MLVEVVVMEVCVVFVLAQLLEDPRKYESGSFFGGSNLR